MLRLRSSLVLCSLLASTTASGHLGQEQFGRFPFIEDGVVVGGGTSWGVVRPDEVFGGWARVCEESFGPAVTFALHQPTRGRVLLGGIDGIEFSLDDGCSWTIVDNVLAGTFPNALWVDPDDAAHLIVGTSTIGADNGLWQSHDFGDTFQPLFAPRAGNFFNIAVSADGERIAASGNDGTGHILMVMSNDGGASFVDVSAVVDNRVIVSAFFFDGDDLIFGGLAPSTQGFIDRGVFNGTTLVVESIGLVPRQTTHALKFNDAILTIARNGARGELYRENDSELGFGAIADGPTECLFVVDDVLWGCGKQAGVNTSLFVRSTDAESWTTDITFIDVHYRACPEGSAGAVGCATFVETFCGNGLDDDLDGLKDCDDDDCHFNPLCAGVAEGEGEGEPGTEGEGEPGSGEGEGEPGDGSEPPADGCACATSSTSSSTSSAPSSSTLLAGVLLSTLSLLRRARLR